MQKININWNWEENSGLRHQHISSLLDGLEGSKAFNKMLLEVSLKIGEEKSKKKLNCFNATGFDCDQEVGEPHI